MAQKWNKLRDGLLYPHDPAPTMSEGCYSGDQPNQGLRRFVAEHARPFDLDADTYNVVAFTHPITTTKATAIYNMHSYWSKKPHDAIQEYVRHYTSVGDVVLDPFCGSGGTAVASLLEGRTSIAVDRSPAATFITKVSCTPIDVRAFQEAFATVRIKAQPVIDWLYETRCDRCGGRATTGYTVYSQVFKCPRCLTRLPLFDCPARRLESRQKEVPVCPHCLTNGHLEEISSRSETFGPVPVKVVYSCLQGCRPARGERVHNDPDVAKRRYFEECDLGKIREIESNAIPFWYPRHHMMNVEDGNTPWGDKWRAGTSNFRTVSELFTKRNLWAIASLRDAIMQENDSSVRDALLFAMTGVALIRFRGHLPKGGYDVPHVESRPWPAHPPAVL